MNNPSSHGSEKSGTKAEAIKRRIVSTLRVYVYYEGGQPIPLVTLDGDNYFPLKEIGGQRFTIDPNPSWEAQTAQEEVNRAQSYKVTD